VPKGVLPDGLCFLGRLLLGLRRFLGGEQQVKLSRGAGCEPQLAPVRLRAWRLDLDEVAGIMLQAILNRHQQEKAECI